MYESVHESNNYLPRAAASIWWGMTVCQHLPDTASFLPTTDLVQLAHRQNREMCKQCKAGEL